VCNGNCRMKQRNMHTRVHRYIARTYPLHGKRPSHERGNAIQSSFMYSRAAFQENCLRIYTISTLTLQTLDQVFLGCGISVRRHPIQNHSTYWYVQHGGQVLHSHMHQCDNMTWDYTLYHAPLPTSPFYHRMPKACHSLPQYTI